MRPRHVLDPTLVERLSPRQREVLALIGAGYTNEEIGTQLTISTRTAETHRDHLMRRLDLHTVADLTRLALLAGLLTLN